MGARFPSTGGGIGDTQRALGALGSVVSVGAAAPGSGSTGDQFVVKSDGRIIRSSSPSTPVEAWGAVGNGTTDDTTAIQAAISALVQTGNSETSGGRIRLTASKTYKITGPLNCDGLLNITLDGGSQGAHGGAVISAAFTAASTQSIISARSSRSFAITGGLALVNSDTTYAGTAVDLSTRPADVNITNTDRASLSRFRIDLAQNAGSTATGILLTNAQACSINDVWITGGRDGIVGVLTGTDFANGISVTRLFAQNQNRIAIRNPYQGWTVEKSVIEPLLSGAAGAVLVDSGIAMQSLRYVGNQHGDSTTGGSWLSLRGGGGFLFGNHFTTGNACVTLPSTFDGLTIIGNRVDTMPVVAWALGTNSPTNVLIAGNNYGSGVTNPPWSGTFGNGSFILDSMTSGFLGGTSSLNVGGPVIVTSAGNGLRVKEGTNAKQGVATLIAGTVVVSNTAVTASSRIMLTAQDGSTTGALRVSARTVGASFTITSSNVGDTGVVAYQIFEPA